MIQNHVTNRELSQALVDAGIVLDTYFHWVYRENGYYPSSPDYGWDWYVIDGRVINNNTDALARNLSSLYEKIIPAPTSDELGEVLPVYIDEEYRRFRLRIVKEFNGYVVLYANFVCNAVPHIIEDTLADGLGRMLLYLVKEGIVTVESLRKEEG